jgi:hypothetical protein
MLKWLKDTLSKYKITQPIEKMLPEILPKYPCFEVGFNWVFYFDEDSDRYIPKESDFGDFQFAIIVDLYGKYSVIPKENILKAAKGYSGNQSAERCGEEIAQSIKINKHQYWEIMIKEFGASAFTTYAEFNSYSQAQKFIVNFIEPRLVMNQLIAI